MDVQKLNIGYISANEVSLLSERRNITMSIISAINQEMQALKSSNDCL
jgi:hypothetical protein